MQYANGSLPSIASLLFVAIPLSQGLMLVSMLMKVDGRGKGQQPQGNVVVIFVIKMSSSSSLCIKRKNDGYMLNALRTLCF